MHPGSGDVVLRTCHEHALPRRRMNVTGVPSTERLSCCLRRYSSHLTGVVVPQNRLSTALAIRCLADGSCCAVRASASRRTCAASPNGFAAKDALSALLHLPTEAKRTPRYWIALQIIVTQRVHYDDYLSRMYCHPAHRPDKRGGGKQTN